MYAMFVEQGDMCQIEEAMEKFSNKFHGSRWNIFLAMDEHIIDPFWHGGNYRPFFLYILHNVSKNMLKCNWIMIIVPMPWSNKIEVFF